MCIIFKCIYFNKELEEKKNWIFSIKYIYIIKQYLYVCITLNAKKIPATEGLIIQKQIQVLQCSNSLDTTKKLHCL